MTRRSKATGRFLSSSGHHLTYKPFGYGQKCGATTRSGGKCSKTLGHSGGHRK